VLGGEIVIVGGVAYRARLEVVVVGDGQVAVWVALSSSLWGWRWV
jgi:hypothetical protein